MTKRYFIAFAALAMLSGFFYISIHKNISSVEIQSFHSEAPAACRPSDVDLTSPDVEEFFRKAAEVNSRHIHDEYDLAPCYLKGSLLHGLKRCTWTIRPGAIGTLQCGTDFNYFVCEQCEGLARVESMDK